MNELNMRYYVRIADRMKGIDFGSPMIRVERGSQIIHAGVRPCVRGQNVIVKQVREFAKNKRSA